MTKSLKTMLQTQKGYRSDILFGSPRYLYNILDILEHEYEELGNEDIVDTMYELNYIEEPTYEAAKQYLETMQTVVGQTLKGVWLVADPADLEEYIPDDDDEETEELRQDMLDTIREVELPEIALPISDLGTQGVLWVVLND